MLHEFDFKNSKEKIVQEIYFRENDEEGSDSRKRDSVASLPRERGKKTRPEKIQYNVTFSKEFG